MANKKITQLNVNTNPTVDDVFPIVNSGETKQLSLSGLTSYLQPFFSGGSSTFTGGTVNGLTADTISATTYQNLPKSMTDFGLTVISPSIITNDLTLPDNSIVTYIAPLTFDSGVTLTIPANTVLQPANVIGGSSSMFTGGTVSGPTNFTNGLTANTISATTYQNLPISASDAGFSITARTSTSINANVILPPDCATTHSSPLIMGVGYSLTVPITTTLTVI